MREAIATAEVGDDVFGEDPTVAALESEAATFLGKPAAMFVPSGTMANQCAIHSHCRSGDEVICDERSHTYVYEGGGIARLTGAQVRTLSTPRGFPTPDQLRGAMRPADVHFARSRLLIVENTHNMAGGTVLGAEETVALCRTAHELGLAAHIDGARLCNAAVALGVAAADLVAEADSVSLCLSKGLGAPVGSVLAGSVEFVALARRARKAFGGGMRQAGILAAAGRLALRDGPALLATDHARARRMAEAFAALPGVRVTPPDTNILMVDLVDADPADLLRALTAAGVRTLAVGPARLRFVTHRDLTDGDIDACIAAVTRWAEHR